MKECYKIKKLFGPYIYNKITPAEHQAVEEHIKICNRCLDDLRSRQVVLGKFMLHLQPGEMTQGIQDDFALNVYKKIALDVLKQRSQRITMRKFVLHPSLAVAALLIVVAIGFLRFYPGQAREDTRVISFTVNIPSNAGKAEKRKPLYAREFTKSQSIRQEGKSKTIADDKKTTISEQPPEVSTASRLSSDMDKLMHDSLIPDARRLLEEANFINFSLGEPRRALAEYQRVVDNYPNTDDAREARTRINSILSSEYRIQVQEAVLEEATDMGI